jgi:hypothetical protein
MSTGVPPVRCLREWGEQNCSPLLLEQFWLRRLCDLCGESGLSPEAIAARTFGGNDLRRGRTAEAVGWAMLIFNGLLHKPLLLSEFDDPLYLKWYPNHNQIANQAKTSLKFQSIVLGEVRYRP